MNQSTRSTPSNRSSIPMRVMSGVLVLTMTLLGGCPVAPGASPEAGIRDYQVAALVPFRYGNVNAIGGNLNARRIDLSIDTLIGTLEIGASYNSATQEWTWSFDEHFKHGVFTDASGASHNGLNAIADGAAIAGTAWVKISPFAMKTKSGLVREFQWSSGNLRRMHWGGTTYPRLNFTEAPVAALGPRVIAVSQCRAIADCADLYSISYDSAGRVEAIEDHTGRRAEFTWNGSQLVGARDGLDVAEGRPGWTYEYSLSGLLTAMTNGEGERTEISYGSGRVTAVRNIGEGDPTKLFFYQGENNGHYATRYWDELATEHIYTYDGLGQLVDIENVALGEHTTWAYGPGLRPTSMTDNTGLTTHYTWAGDDLVAEREPSGNVIQYTYEPLGTNRPTEVTELFEDDFANSGHRPFLKVEDGIGVIEERTYDTDGSLLSITRGDGAEGETHTFTYQKGLMQTVEPPNGPRRTLQDYGWHGHPLSLSSLSGGKAQARTFDAVGNRTTGSVFSRPGEGGIVSRAFDADRNERVLTLEDGGTIAVDVRSDGERTRIQRPGGDEHQMTHDELGRMVARRERVDGLWQTTVFELDAKGRRVAVEKPNGMRRELTYDDADRVTNVTNLRSGTPESWSAATFTNGRMSSRYDSVHGATEYYSYDYAGRLTNRVHFEGTHTLQTHDARSRKLSDHYLDASLNTVRVLSYGYDSLDRETTITDGQLNLLTRSFADGLLDEITYGNGLTRTFEHNVSGQLESITTRDSNNVLIELTTIDRTIGLSLGELNLRIDVVTTTLNTLTNATTTESHFLSPFNDVGAQGINGARVTGWAEELGPAATVFNFTYDGKSNLLGKDTKTYTYNTEGNRLLSVSEPGQPTLTYSYDAAGYTTARGTKSLTWTANGLIASHGADQFEWDAIGCPVSATVDGDKITWLFGGAVHGDAAGWPSTIQGDDFTIDLTTNEHLYRHQDFRENVKFTTDDVGEVQAHYGYSAYGLEVVHGSDEDNVRFVGRTEIGELMILGVRVYDPALGRFLSQDPIFQSVNQYSYTLGNPIWWSDRNGAQATPSGILTRFAVVAGLVAAFSAIFGALAFTLAFGAIAAIFAFFAGFLSLTTPPNGPRNRGYAQCWGNRRDTRNWRSTSQVAAARNAYRLRIGAVGLRRYAEGVGQT